MKTRGMWAMLVNRYATGPDEIEEFGEALQEIQRETARRLAQQVRSLPMGAPEAQRVRNLCADVVYPPYHLDDEE